MEDTTKQENIDIDQFIGDARDRNDLFRIIFDYSADAIFVVAKSGTVIFFKSQRRTFI